MLISGPIIQFSISSVSITRHMCCTVREKENPTPWDAFLCQLQILFPAANQIADSKKQ